MNGAPYTPPIYESMTSAEAATDEMLRNLLGWPSRPHREPTDAELGAAFRAAAKTADGKTEFLTRLGRELDRL